MSGTSRRRTDNFQLDGGFKATLLGTSTFAAAAAMRPYVARRPLGTWVTTPFGARVADNHRFVRLHDDPRVRLEARALPAGGEAEAERQAARDLEKAAPRNAHHAF